MDDALGRDGQVSVLDDIRSIVIAVSHANIGAEVAAASGRDQGTLVGLGEKAVHVGADAPDDSLTMGSLTSLAVQILSRKDLETERLIRHICFSYRDGSPPEFNSRSQGSALEILSRFPGASAALRRRILRSVDRDLSPLHRLVHQTPLRDGRELHPNEMADDPASKHLPLLAWPNWTQPLDCDGNFDSSALRRAIIAGVAFVARYASVEHASSRDKGWLRRQLRNNLLGDSEATSRTLNQICELANFLQRTPVVIRYELRPHLDWKGFLSRAEWIEIASLADFHAGDATRHKLVRRYMFNRITASTDELAPSAWFNSDKRDRTSTLTTFSMTITHEVRIMLDEYAKAFLLLHSIDEPVVWSPPRDAVGGMPTAGRELPDIDLAAIHDMETRPGKKPSLKAIVAEVGRSERHVRLVIDEWLPSTGQSNSIDWYPRLFADLQARDETEKERFFRQYGEPPQPST